MIIPCMICIILYEIAVATLLHLKDKNENEEWVELKKYPVEKNPLH